MKGISRKLSLSILAFLVFSNHVEATEQIYQTPAALIPTEIPTTPIAGLINPLLEAANPQLLGQSLGQMPLLTFIYQTQQYQILWRDKQYAGQVIQLLAQADQDGLNPNDYHLATLQSLHLNLQQANQQALEPNDQSSAAQFDILLSDAVLTFAHHLHNGKLNPAELDPTWNYDPAALEHNATSVQLLQHIQQQTIAELFEQQRPQYDLYGQLKQALARYRAIAERYPFEVITIDIKSIKPGMLHPAIPLLKKRLQQLGYSFPEITNEAFESALEREQTYHLAWVETIKQFQQHHDLDTDGVIGPATLAALNIPYQQRAEKIKINLERARWLATDLSQEFIIVNIAGFELFFYQSGQLNWQTKVMVGTPLNATPVFKSQLQYLEFNPTWTVPRSILKEMWHKILNEPDYLIKQQYQVVQNNGRPVELTEIDWEAYTARNFPYHLVQQPWKNNALGQVKFIFPNRHSVFLHDTPQKRLFNSAQRSFSHGCIRVENPMELARLLLNDDANWSAQNIAHVVASEKRTRVNIKRPIDVFLMYWTVSVSGETVSFHHDLYQRDDLLLKRL
ncbi:MULTISPECIES: L,D-transpeptidase family protein [unclassified Motilimonas]|uniref:L,D-transpeptidase family protein n=1 Tax=unclassified Motilimonas TaxID=2643697 RepID=UPI001E483E27|nr:MULTISPECIES: L,D-transpeptidase family protein [unclassified Motilimonas]MCE0557220.1 L,D-transpeptidase family protein [Motilimonas sp. E26]MDO6526179.1 L,D-transpeptidase family protein [Motilimonas sp. 1_MG-2023]